MKNIVTWNIKKKKMENWYNYFAISVSRTTIVILAHNQLKIKLWKNQKKTQKSLRQWINMVVTWNKSLMFENWFVKRLWHLTSRSTMVVLAQLRI